MILINLFYSLYVLLLVFYCIILKIHVVELIQLFASVFAIRIDLNWDNHCLPLKLFQQTIMNMLEVETEKDK